MTTEAPPTRFWISSLGEYGHHYADGTESTGGTINVTDLCKSVGVKNERKLTQQDWDRAWSTELWHELRDHREFAVWKSWEHLNALGTADFRFFGGYGYEGTDYTKGPYVTMVIEYILDDDDTESLDVLQANAQARGATVDEMFTHTHAGHHRWVGSGPPVGGADDPGWEYVPHEKEGQTYTQYGVEFGVWGKSLPEVAALQVRWLTAVTVLDEQMVAVL